ncbi:MAG: radical SAM protein [Anaerolineaceae bacterium]|nr:radical SAM protein [Anaerolineaceae bacterium]
MSLIDQLKDRFFTRFVPLQPGVYHYQAPPDASFPYRLHLRVEKDGDGIMIVNASTVLHLNQTAAEYAFHLINQTPKDEVASKIARRFRVDKTQALADYDDLVERLETMISTPDLDPVTFLGFDRQEPYSGDITAPYRLDCALTYQVLEQKSDDVAPIKRVDRELTTVEWKQILKKAWDAGIPHVIFTGGEPTLRPDLPDLILYAEELGQVTGLLTNGLRLAEPAYLEQLLQNGLDHLMIVLDPKEDQAWEALRDSLADDIFTTVHLTITQQDTTDVLKLIDRLTEMDVESISLSANSHDLKKTLQEIQHAVAVNDISLEWDLPVPYSNLNPVALELEEDESETRMGGAGKAWLYIEPDGDVLAAQGMPDVLGNLLTDTWDEIWISEESK